jgi:hypothetical protein
MLSCARLFLISLVIGLAASAPLAQEKPASSPTQSPKPSATPAVDEWSDDFNGKELDQQSGSGSLSRVAMAASSRLKRGNFACAA